MIGLRLSMADLNEGEPPLYGRRVSEFDNITTKRILSTDYKGSIYTLSLGENAARLQRFAWFISPILCYGWLENVMRQDCLRLGQ